MTNSSLQTRHSHAGEGANEVGKSDRVRVDGLPGSPDVQQPQRTKQVQSSKVDHIGPLYRSDLSTPFIGALVFHAKSFQL